MPLKLVLGLLARTSKVAHNIVVVAVVQSLQLVAVDLEDDLETRRKSDLESL